MPGPASGVRVSSAMAALPSYREATERQDWLRLVVPYVASSDYPTLCAVSKHAWQVFAPLLWRDVFETVRQAGLSSDDDLEWWFDFVYAKLDSVRFETRALARVLDARAFAKDAYHFRFSSEQKEVTVHQSFKRALGLFPNVTCLLIDGHQDVDPGSLLIPTPLWIPSAGPGSSNNHHNDHRRIPADCSRLRLLSLADCPNPLPSTFSTTSLCLQGLVYLDISGIPGSVCPLLQPGSKLLGLRILKTRHRELDDAIFNALLNAIGRKLWSLDVSFNNITDDAIDVLCAICFPKSSSAGFRTDARFSVEGTMVMCGRGMSDYGPFAYIQESEWSGSMSHPERYLVDPPTYVRVADPEGNPHGLHCAVRSNGRELIRSDVPDDLVDRLSSVGVDVDVSVADEPALDSLRVSSGLTHLRLSDNRISALGFEKLLRMSNGHLEHIACDSMPLIGTGTGTGTALSSSSSSSSQTHSRKIWPKAAKLFGTLGAAHLLRPVVSSNLQVLRLHHSVVTQIPTLEMERLTTLARLYIAETVILPRCEEAYPQAAAAFVPDMNPRLRSITLTRLPRRSSGPLIDKLIRFLKLLSQQERDIQDAHALLLQRRQHSFSRRRRDPCLLDGLRHLRLEFEPDPLEESFSAAEDFDAGELLEAGDRGFSFFDKYEEEGEERRKLPVTTPAEVVTVTTNTGPSRGRSNGVGSGGVRDDDAWISEPMSEMCHRKDSSKDSHFKEEEEEEEKDTDRESDRDDGDDELVMHRGEWNGQDFTIPVWVGPVLRPRGRGSDNGNDNSNSVLEDYRQLVLEHGVRDHVGPASPAQVQAGAPRDSYVFHGAWSMAVMPRELSRFVSTPPPWSELSNKMKDVLEELKRYRLAGRARYAEMKSSGGRSETRLGEPHYFWTGKLEVSK